jgi:ATP-dependent Clp protease ATP-binding subunit ClpA
MFERFTDSARQAVAAAEVESRNLESGYIGTQHLLIAIAAETQGLGGRVLRELGATAEDLRQDAKRHADPSLIDPDALATLGIDYDEVKRRVEATFGPGALARGRSTCGGIPFSRRAKKSLELALRCTLSLNDNFIGSEHLLLGLAGTGDSTAQDILVERGLDLERLDAAVRARRAA